MLTVQRLFRRAIVGLVGRGSQGLLLAAAIVFLGGPASSDLAVALTLCTVMNMVSNAGIPTLFVRGGHRGWPRMRMLGLARVYVSLTAIAGAVVVPVLWMVTSDAFLAVASGLLLLAQSTLTGYEYWVLGKGTKRYDAFLKRAGTLQAALSLLAPLAIVATDSASWGIAVLGMSYVVAVLGCLPKSAMSIVRDIWPRDLRLDQWGRDAAVIGLGTVLSALFYGADVLVLRVSAMPDLVAEYRLAVVVVAFVIGILPIGLFVLADASAGRALGLGRISILVALCIAAVTLLGVMLRFGPTEFKIVGLSLVLLGPLAGVRLVTQVLSSHLNGGGHHWRVSASYAAGIAGWLIVGSLLAFKGATALTMALSQTLVEFVVLVCITSNFWRVRRLVN